MITRGNKEIAVIYRGKKVIAEIRRGAILVWQAVRSCFGKGYWVDDKPYDNEEGWKNN